MKNKHYFFEKVTPMHPDKIADRIAGAIVDLVYRECKRIDKRPICAAEVLIGHGECNIIGEVNTALNLIDIESAVHRIANDKNIKVKVNLSAQDTHLADNQSSQEYRCGDNGIFKGVPADGMELAFTNLISMLYDKFQSDGKGLIHISRSEEGVVETDITICQSNANKNEIDLIIKKWFNIYETFLNLNKNRFNVKINPLGSWTGGLNVDTGATNRKLGSDMSRAVTGGGLMGKDCSKADVTLNILAYLMAQRTGRETRLMCSIGDCIIFNEERQPINTVDYLNGMTYSDAVDLANKYIRDIGGFEKFAEWGIIQPTIPYENVDY